MSDRRSNKPTRKPWRRVLIFLGMQLALIVAFAILGASASTILWTTGLLSAAAMAFVAFVGAPYVKREFSVSSERNQELIAQRDLLERITETSPIGIVAVDLDGHIWMVNRMAEDILGLDRGVISSRTYRDPAWRQVDAEGMPLPADKLPLARVLSTGETVTDDIHGIQTAGGQLRWLSVNAAALRGESGAMTGAIATFLDVTERFSASQLLRANEHLLHSSMDNMLEGCQILSHDWEYLYLNEVAGQHARLPVEGLLGRKFTEMWPGVQSTELYAHMAACLADGTPTKMENEFEYPDGSTGWFELSIQPVPEGMLILSTEVTERRRAEEELRLHQQHLEQLVDARTAELKAINRELDSSNEQLQSANAELESLNQNLDAANTELMEATSAKDRLLANIGHEFRTPLNSIIGFSGVLSQGLAGDLNEEQVRQLEMINRAGNRLLGLIDDMLAVSRIETGHVELEWSWFDAGNLVREVVESLEHTASDKGLEIRAEVPQGLVRLDSDEGKIRQILLNLADNALKFTRAGSVRVALVPDNDTLRFEVSDSGPGIPAAEHERVFEAFSQIEDITSAKPDGTGLGLAICREYALLLGGSIELVSTPGSGSTFTLVLPERRLHV